MTISDFLGAIRRRAVEVREGLPFSMETVEAHGIGIFESYNYEALRELEDQPSIRSALESLSGIFAVVGTGEGIILSNFEAGADVMNGTRTIPHGAPVMWPADALDREGVCILSETLLDALSLIDAGANAVYVNGAGLHVLTEKARSTASPSIVVLYGDDEGVGNAEETKRTIERSGAPCALFRVPDGQEWVGQSLRDLIETIEDFAETGTALRLSAYEMTSAGARVPEFREYILKDHPKPVSTGIRPLDEVLDGGLYPGLYVLGANSSLGKTSLALQMADTIASTNDVLFFTVEQSEFELMAKSVSRLSFLMRTALDEPLTARDILNPRNPPIGRRAEFLEQCIDAYGSSSPRLYFFEDDHSRQEEGRGADTRIGMDTIRNAVSNHINLAGRDRKPVVFIDYLQILAPEDPTGRLSDKQSIDLIVSELRRMTRDMGLSIVLISSKNRASYTGSSDMGGFKESGIIEYSADVVLELQPQDMTGADTPTGKRSDVERLKDTRASEVRRMTLEVAKNRMGRTHRGIPLIYEARYNHFEPAPSEPSKDSYVNL